MTVDIVTSVNEGLGRSARLVDLGAAATGA